MSNERDYGFYPREKKKNKGLVIGLSIGFGVILLLGLIISVSFFFKSVLSAAFASGEYYENYYDEDYDNYEDYDNSYYEPDESDPYYKEITDATETDLSYSILWSSVSVSPDDPGDYCTYYSVYPLVEGENVPNLNAMNAAIQDMLLKYQDCYRDYTGGCSSYGYVTYMDEEKMSIVAEHSLYGEEETQSEIQAVTFRMDTGEVINGSEMITPDAELALRFRAQDKTQNGGVDFVNNLNDDELLDYLQDKEKAVFFYSPVGLEVGFNFEEGWVTVTLKEYTL